MGKLLESVCQLDALYDAWRAVRAQVRRSAWPHLTEELHRFEAAPLRELRRLRRQLQSRTYRFVPKACYTKRKSGGSRRGITVHGIRDRIVQRVLLDALQSTAPPVREQLGSLPAILDVPTSFAGHPGRGVPEAIAAVVQIMGAGARAYVSSDIKEFFPCVPRAEVVDLVRQNIEDEAFVDLFRAALETQIQVNAEVAPWIGLFPLSETGVAQGSLLSVLAGNLLLGRFDRLLNVPPLQTIRYLDDFAIFGPDVATVAAGFELALRECARVGMSCYRPRDGSQKAFQGLVSRGMTFLGCAIHPHGVAPGRVATRKLIKEIAVALGEARRTIDGFLTSGERRQAEPTYAQTLAHIDSKLRGWGNAYRFVTNRLPFSQTDAAVDRMLADFQRWFERRCRSQSDQGRRRVTGVALLADTPRDVRWPPVARRADARIDSLPGGAVDSNSIR